MQTTAPTTAPKVRFFFKEKEIIPTTTERFLDRKFRRMLQSIGDKQVKKFGHLVHPETGERPEIWLVVENPLTGSVSIRLVTDSEPLRSWLKSKGVVIGEALQKEGVDEPAVIPENPSQAA
ncbi:hypothetical protein [Bosea sp. RAC05]|uniref:hypothetical protein n=1 Tax=Bosea sp. RAC05 TaxID=1842539 RepID=UPI00083DE0A9|nr:hypothetical protein [Bosea sp. RAC05]AOG03420.1 hypothetical protein BSY19_5081 [Bosea sp. RAC05]